MNVRGPWGVSDENFGGFFLPDIWEKASSYRPMRLVRPGQSWLVLLPSRGEGVCLQRLAMRCGYRICEICAELDCSERYLFEVFSRDIGLSPKKWMRAERMVVAGRKLAGGRSPEEVAMELGFASANSFRREFMTVYRIPPLDFQRERRGE